MTVRYTLRKLGTLLLTLFLISILAFLAFQVIPGDPAVQILGINATPESLEALREELGFNRPLPVQYVDWLRAFFFGDMGPSYAHGGSVRELLGDRLTITGSLMGMSFLLTVLIALPVGLLTVGGVGNGSKPFRRGGPGGTVWNRSLQWFVTMVTQMVMAVPPLFLGLVLTFVFGAVFRVFTPSAFVSFRDSVWGYLGYMFFPALAIALPKVAMTIRVIRTSVVDEMRKDYVQTSVSRGEGPRGLLYRHVLPNIAVPVITFLTLALIMMITDSIVIEQVFSIPGAGRLLISAIGARDFPVVQALVVIIAAFVMGAHALVDVICRAIDPRITL